MDEIIPAIDERTLKQKLLFYTTAFFVLLGTFSLFGFLFLVPFVIEPAFQTIFMEFDEGRAQCFTDETIVKAGTKNCTWTSCREGCTRDIYTCTQIYVNYKVFKNGTNPYEKTVMVSWALDLTSYDWMLIIFNFLFGNGNICRIHRRLPSQLFHLGQTMTVDESVRMIIPKRKNTVILIILNCQILLIPTIRMSQLRV